MINKYNKFKEDLLIESINESFLYYSPNLLKVISKVGGDISTDLISAERTDIKPDITFVDIDKEGYLSFITSKNAAKNLSITFKGDEDIWFRKLMSKRDIDEIWLAHQRGIEHDVYNKSRNSIKIGKLINKLFPNKYTDKQIEDFVNKFKSTIENSSEKFEIVEGDDISFWYNKKNYISGGGSLSNSCMANKSGIFDIYSKNPGVCKMLILKEDDKISGRALIWKLETLNNNKTDVYFMDRQYTIKESDVEKFRTYAKEKKWIYKAYNNHYSYVNVVDNDITKNYKMTVKVDNIKYDSYPYLDTFRRYDPESGILYNDEDQSKKNNGQYLLDNTDGGYTEIESGHYSEYYDTTIPEDNAVYSDRYGDWIYRDRAQLVGIGQSRYRGWYVDDDEDIVYDEWLEEPLHINDAVYSDPYGYWLYSENAVRVINEIYPDGDVSDDDNWYHMDDNEIVSINHNMVWYVNLSKKFSTWFDYEYVLKDLVIINHEQEWVPKIFSIKEYKLIPTDNAVDITGTGIEYLEELDAEVLGYEIDKNEEIISDKFQYYEDIEEFLPIIYRRLSDEWVKINNQLKGKGQLRIKFKDFDEDDYLESLKKRAELLNNKLEEIENDEFIDSDITITRNN